MPVIAGTLAVAEEALSARRWDLVLLSVHSEQTNAMTRLVVVKRLAGRTPLAVLMMPIDTASPDQIVAALNRARRGSAQLLLGNPYTAGDVEAAIRKVDVRLADHQRLQTDAAHFVD